MRHEHLSVAEYQARYRGGHLGRSHCLTAPHRKGEMNKTEQLYARRLDAEKAEGVIDGYEFEPITFRLKGKKQTYTIDFMVWKRRRIWFVEIKAAWKIKYRAGRISAGAVRSFTDYHPGWQPDAWEKFKTCRGEFPMLTIRCVWWHPGEKVWKEQAL